MMPSRATWPRLLALGQATGYVATGLWPIIDISSIERVTGPKRDDWLVRTVGGLAVAFGAGLALRADDARAARPFGVASASAFLAADLIGVASGRLRRIYLADAAAEAVILAGWIASAVLPQQRTAPRPVASRALPPTVTPTHARAAGRAHATDLTHLRQELEELHADAVRAADLAWPDGRAPDAVTEALHRLHEAKEHVAFATEGDDPARLAELAATAAEDAASVHEAADLISS